jgi:carbon monoxide dehydrogenase subunit G
MFLMIVDRLVNKNTRGNPKDPFMELTGDIVIGAERSRVWVALNDPQVLAACIPGCEAVDVVSPVEKTARVMVKVGPVRARFSGRILLSDVIDNERCSLSFEGSGGAAGMARGQSQVELSDEGAGTRLRYTVQASVAGKLGQVGGRMIDAAAKQMADQFFNAFQEQLAPAAAARAQPGLEAADLAAGEGVPGALLLTDGPSEPLVPTSPDAAQTTTAASGDAKPGARPGLPAARSASAPAPASPLPSSEWLRVRWFVLGSLATGFGVWIGSRL